MHMYEPRSTSVGRTPHVGDSPDSHITDDVPRLASPIPLFSQPRLTIRAWTVSRRQRCRKWPWADTCGLCDHILTSELSLTSMILCGTSVLGCRTEVSANQRLHVPTSWRSKWCCISEHAHSFLRSDELFPGEKAVLCHLTPRQSCAGLRKRQCASCPRHMHTSAVLTATSARHFSISAALAEF